MTVKVIQKALAAHDIPEAAIQAIENPDRQLVSEMLKMDRYIDMLIPRGGAGLHKLCREQSTIPVITGGIGVCHLYVDETMETDAALEIIVNAKKQRPSACNSLETLLIHQDIVTEFLPRFCQRMAAEQITLHADENILPEIRKFQPDVQRVRAAEYDDEWLSLDLNVKQVSSLDQAVSHIREHGTQHSDGILSRSLKMPISLSIRSILQRYMSMPVQGLLTEVSLVWGPKWR